MVWWSREFDMAVEEATKDIPTFQPYMHKFYVDDNDLITEEMPPGSALQRGLCFGQQLQCTAM
jgi:hypothetical protein